MFSQNANATTYDKNEAAWFQPWAWSFSFFALKLDGIQVWSKTLDDLWIRPCTSDGVWMHWRLLVLSKQDGRTLRPFKCHQWFCPWGRGASWYCSEDPHCIPNGTRDPGSFPSWTGEPRFWSNATNNPWCIPNGAGDDGRFTSGTENPWSCPNVTEVQI